jgi:type I restriction enzyme R subunit
MAKRGHQPNMSFFAFTATPKHKTLATFGRDGELFHRYSMRQAHRGRLHRGRTCSIA